MTVAELILKLQDLPQWLPVIAPTSELREFNEIEHISIITEFNPKTNRNEEAVEVY